PACAPGVGPHHRRPGRAGRLPTDRRGGSQEGKSRGPARPPPATVGGARPAAETADGPRRAGGPPRLAEASAVREGLNEPGPGLHDGTIRSLPSAAWIAPQGAARNGRLMRRRAFPLAPPPGAATIRA